MTATSEPAAREAARRSSCQNNLKQWGLVFKMYSNEAKGMFPIIQGGMFPTKSRLGQPDPTWTSFDFGPNLFSLYPEYLTDPNLLMCPSDSELGEIKQSIVDENGQSCLGYTDPQDKCASAVDASYGYGGWVFDQLSLGAMSAKRASWWSCATKPRTASAGPGAAVAASTMASIAASTWCRTAATRSARVRK